MCDEIESLALTLMPVDTPRSRDVGSRGVRAVHHVLGGHAAAADREPRKLR